MCVFSVRAGSRDQNDKNFTFHESTSKFRKLKKNSKSISSKGLILLISKKKSYFSSSIRSNTKSDFTSLIPPIQGKKWTSHQGIRLIYHHFSLNIGY